MGKKTKIATAVLAGAVIGATAALIAESKTAKKAIKGTKARLTGIMQEAVRELQKMRNKKLSAREYDKLIRDISWKYSKAKQLTKADGVALVKELTQYWHHIAKHLK